MWGQRSPQLISRQQGLVAAHRFHLDFYRVNFFCYASLFSLIARKFSLLWWSWEFCWQAPDFSSESRGALAIPSQRFPNFPVFARTTVSRPLLLRWKLAARSILGGCRPLIWTYFPASRM